MLQFESQQKSVEDQLFLLSFLLRVVEGAEAFHPSFAHVLLPAVVCACVLFVFVMLLCHRRNHKGQPGFRSIK